MYDPTVGRFITEDTIGFAGRDTNLYRYVGNSPINATDPMGQSEHRLIIRYNHPPGGGISKTYLIVRWDCDFGGPKVVESYTLSWPAGDFNAREDLDEQLRLSKRVDFLNQDSLLSDLIEMMEEESVIINFILNDQNAKSLGPPMGPPRLCH